jgi:Fur family transcriptional regulator, ferric uptake regulator
MQTALNNVTVAVSPAEKYREYLATKGLRLTRERSIIIEEVFASHEHFDAEQLIGRLAQRTDGTRVSRSTIYRSLLQLEEAGLIRKVARQDDRDVFEHDYGYPQHDHLICSKCGTLIEFQADAISQVLSEVASRHGFRMDGHRLEVTGLCDACCRPPASRPKKLNLL